MRKLPPDKRKGVCQYCHQEFESVSLGRKPKYCCVQHKEADRHQRRKRKPTGRYCLGCGCELSFQAKKYCRRCVADPGVFIGRIQERPCVVCGTVFRPKVDDRICCGEACGKRYGAWLNATGFDKNTVGLCEICGEEFHPRITQPDQRTCGREKCQQRLDTVNKTVTGKRRDVNARRRAIIAGTNADSIDVMAVFERDAWICQICGHAVDSLLPHPHPFSKSLDHIVPLAAGGGHTWGNVQLAHLSCNIRKGDRPCREEDRPSPPN